MAPSLFLADDQCSQLISSATLIISYNLMSRSKVFAKWHVQLSRFRLWLLLLHLFFNGARYGYSLSSASNVHRCASLLFACFSVDVLGGSLWFVCFGGLCSSWPSFVPFAVHCCRQFFVVLQGPFQFARLGLLLSIGPSRGP